MVKDEVDQISCNLLVMIEDMREVQSTLRQLKNFPHSDPGHLSGWISSLDGKLQELFQTLTHLGEHPVLVNFIAHLKQIREAVQSMQNFNWYDTSGVPGRDKGMGVSNWHHQRSNPMAY